MTNIWIVLAISTYERCLSTCREGVSTLLHEDAVTDSLVGTCVGSGDSLFECTIVRHHEVVSLLLNFWLHERREVDDNLVGDIVVSEVAHAVSRETEDVVCAVVKTLVLEDNGLARNDRSEREVGKRSSSTFSHLHLLVECEHHLAIGRSTRCTLSRNRRNENRSNAIVHQFGCTSEINVGDGVTVVGRRRTVDAGSLVWSPTNKELALVVGFSREFHLTEGPVLHTVHGHATHLCVSLIVERVFHIISSIGIVVVEHFELHLDVGECLGIDHRLPVVMTYIAFARTCAPVHSSRFAFITTCSHLTLVEP